MFRFTQNRRQGATPSTYLKLHIWYQCTNIDAVTASINIGTLVPDM